MSTARDTIRTPDEFWAEVQAALDARRDPLADEPIATWLGEHPDAAAECTELLARLAALQSHEPGLAERPRTAARWLALVAASLVAAFAVWTAVPRAPAPARPETAPRITEQRFDPRKFHVERCTIEVVTRTPETVQTTRVTNGAIERSVATTRRGDRAALATVVTRSRCTPFEEHRP